MEVDSSSLPIKVFGCRPVARIAAADKNGWVTYTRRRAADGSGAGFIRARLNSISTSGVWAFDVQDSGGGSRVFPCHVVGKPGPSRIHRAESLKIDALPAN